MLQEKLLTSLKGFLTKSSQSEGLGFVWALSITNIILIVLLGWMLTHLSGNLEFFLITLIITISAGSLVTLLLIKLQRLTVSTQMSQIEAQAYDVVTTPLLIFTPDHLLLHGNQSARENCPWANNFPLLEQSLVSPDTKEAL